MFIFIILEIILPISTIIYCEINDLNTELQLINPQGMQYCFHLYGSKYNFVCYAAF